MRYFPINLDVRGRTVVMIGGGETAVRKIESLLEAGAKVIVYDPRPLPLVRQMAARKKIRWIGRAWRPGDLGKSFLAVAATDDPGTHRAVRSEARKKGILLNVVDSPEFCDFVFPAYLKRGEFLVTVSTGGASPALARKVREELENIFGPEYKTLVDLMGKLRETQEKLPRRGELLTELIHSPVLAYIRRRDRGGLDRLLKLIFGEKISLKSLGVKLEGGGK